MLLYTVGLGTRRGNRKMTLKGGVIDAVGNIKSRKILMSSN